MSLDQESVSASVDAIEAQIKKYRVEIEKLERAKRAILGLASDDLPLSPRKKVRRLGHGVPQQLIRAALSNGAALTTPDIRDAIMDKHNIELGHSTLRSSISRMRKDNIIERFNDKWKLAGAESLDLPHS